MLTAVVTGGDYMANDSRSKPGFGRIAALVVAMIIGGVILSKLDRTATPNASSSVSSVSSKAETYRLIQALGNSENEAARGLSKAECEDRKKELKSVGNALGTYNETLGYGSITCLPESTF
ncbi:hypothetical protein A6U94_09610 [Agrobacterium tumefaciens]|nr:hypothetical protein A6U94_09610 [Agrobacterium tumefaciens]